jgi:hypothetical protein
MIQYESTLLDRAVVPAIRFQQAAEIDIMGRVGNYAQLMKFNMKCP